MPEITFVTVPGADDIIIDDVSLNDVDRFRSQCLLGGSVVCTWDTLHARLMNHDVSRFWWFLTEPERRSIAGKAIVSTLDRTILYYRREENSEWSRLDSPCTYNAIIRFQKFGTPVGWHNCYWAYDTSSPVGVCYVPDHHFGLPTVHVNTHYHVMCGIQVVNNIDSLDNWIVFQYNNPNIKPGNSQMPHGSHIIIQDPFPHASESCIGFDSKVITTFQL